MAPYRVCVVAQKLVRGDGQGRAALELVRALADAGHEVIVCTRAIDSDVASRVRVRHLRRLPSPQLLDDLALLVQATLAVRFERPDITVVVGHSAVPRSPYVYYAHFSHRGWRTTWSAGGRPGWRHRLHAHLSTPLEDLVTRRAAGVFAPSSALVSAIRAPASALRAVVPNGVDPVQEDGDRSNARLRVQIAADELAIGFVGEYFTRRKGLDVLLEAVALGPGDEHVVLAGKGDVRWLERETRRLGIDSRVHRLGFVSPSEVYDACDAVAVPSRYEPFSLVALEAAACGLPVILSTAVGAAEHLDGCALVVDAPPAPASVRRALDELRDSSVRARLGAAARDRARALSWVNTARRGSDFVTAVLQRQDWTD